MILIFNYKNYKDYVLDKINSLENAGRGVRKKMAESINCQPAFITQVLTGKPDFSLEQGLLINQFFNHTDTESECFFLLLQKERSGTIPLRKYFESKIEDLKEKNNSLKERLRTQNHLTDLQKQTYYSSWVYAAVHILICLPQFSSVTKISQALKLNEPEVTTVLDFLINTNLIEQTSEGYKYGGQRIHLEKESPLISRHLHNWRIQALLSAEKKIPDNLHYSLVFSISEQDKNLVNEMLMQTIENIRKILKDSKDEKVQILNLDFFDILK